MLALAVGVLAPTLAFVALELVLRAAGLGPPPPLRLRSPDGSDDAAYEAQNAMFRRDARTGYALRAPYRARTDHSGNYALGEWPWRGRPALPAPPGIARVAVLGDSCAYGLGLVAAETLEEKLADDLESRGWSRAQVQVLNFGVPGYSTVQTASVLDEVIERFAPDVVVLYVGAWNDQSDAVDAPDDVVLRRAAGRTILTDTAVARGVRELGSRLGVDPSERTDKTDGRPVRRVAAEEIEPRVRAMLEHIRAAGATPIVVAPVHRAANVAARPGGAADRDAVRRAAAAEGAVLVDAQRLADASGLREEDLFVDTTVHPSALLWDLVAPRVGTVAAEALGTAPPERAGDLEILTVRPASGSCLGDVEIVVELRGWSSRDALPALVLGGAALVELRAVGSNEVRGLVPTNLPGPHDLLAQTARGVAILRDAVELLPLQVERDGDWLVVHARPGDGALLYVASKRLQFPMFAIHGRLEIDQLALVTPPVRLVIGADGSARTKAPATLGPAFAQALVLPRDDESLLLQARSTGAIGL
ncbi:MAG: GDSL-type esterase/lipase family protein [Planctomycetota bacterium]